MRPSALPPPVPDNPAPSLRQVLAAAAAHLEQAGVPTPRVDAEVLAAFAFDATRSQLILLDAPPAERLGQYWELIARRAEREPLQHLTGETGFRHLTLTVRPGVFVPRPETEAVAGAAIELAGAGRGEQDGEPGPARIVDLCTGAGGIALACAHEIPGAKVWAVDADPEAARLASDNAAANNLPVDALVGDVREEGLLAHLAGTVDVVVANPPYIPFQAEPLEPEVREHDPDLALYGGGVDGLQIPRAVLDRAHELLRPGGWVVIEHGDEQGPAMREAARSRGGFTGVHTRTDLTGRERMVVAQRGEVAH